MEPKMTQEELIKEKLILSVLEEIEHLILCQKYIDQYDENVSLKNEVEVLRQQLAFYKKMVHSQKTEKTEVVMEKTEQLSLFDEAETEATSAYPEKEIVVEKHAHKAKRTHDETRDAQLTDIEACTIRQAWIPVVLQDGKLENILCNRKLEDSIGEILELYDKSTGHIILTFDADVAQTLDSWCNAPFKTTYSLHVSKYLLKAILDKVINCLMEWTLKLEEKGILGKNMTFNEKESETAKDIPQQINNYYGNVIQGNVSESQIVSGNSNTIAYNTTSATDAIQEI